MFSLRKTTSKDDLNAEADSPVSPNSVSKSVWEKEKRQRQQKEYIDADRHVAKTISQKKFEKVNDLTQLMYSNTSENSKGCLLQRAEAIIHKRKMARSEAKNQARNISREENKILVPTQDFLNHRLMNNNSANKQSRQMGRRVIRNQLLFFKGSSEEPVNEMVSHPGGLPQTQPQDMLPSFRQSLVLDNNVSCGKEETYQTYRPPWISPNSKLPSCFYKLGVERVMSSKKRNNVANNLCKFLDVTLDWLFK